MTISSVGLKPVCIRTHRPTLQLRRRSNSTPVALHDYSSLVQHYKCSSVCIWVGHRRVADCRPRPDIYGICLLVAHGPRKCVSRRKSGCDCCWLKKELSRTIRWEDVTALRANTARCPRDTTTQSHQSCSLGRLVELEGRIHVTIRCDQLRNRLLRQRDAHGDRLPTQVYLNIHKVSDGEGRGGDTVIDEAASRQCLRAARVQQRRCSSVASASEHLCARQATSSTGLCVSMTLPYPCSSSNVSEQAWLRFALLSRRDRKQRQRNTKF